MSKRSLTQNQSRRIEQNQKAKLNRAQVDELDASALGREEPGLVIAHFGQTLEVESTTGETIRCFARQNLGALVTGDRVVFCRAEPRGVVTARSERRSLLERPDRYKGSKPMAANIDQILVVVSVEPEPIPLRLDRALVAAAVQGLQAKIILNKTDLINSTNQNEIQELAQLYRHIGYEVIETSIVSQQVSDLKETLAGQNSILVGQSGVGKSSLINHFFGNEVARVGDISEANLKGRHTTTTACLYHCEGDGCVIDSPGIREFGLWNLELEQIWNGFIEFRDFLGQCQFRNCNHQEGAKGCALQKAVLDGQISKARLGRCFQLLEA